MCWITPPLGPRRLGNIDKRQCRTYMYVVGVPLYAILLKKKPFPNFLFLGESGGKRINSKSTVWNCKIEKRGQMGIDLRIGRSFPLNPDNFVKYYINFTRFILFFL